jgi:integrase
MKVMNSILGYHSGLSKSSRRAQDIDLDRFIAFAYDTNQRIKTAVNRDELYQKLHTELSIWSTVDEGVLVSFVDWMKERPLATATIARNLSTIRKHCELACEAGFISRTSYLHIKAVSMKSENSKTRNLLSPGKVRALKENHDTLSEQGVRDKLFMACLLDIGIRPSDLSVLTFDNIRWGDAPDKTLIVFKPKKTSRFPNAPMVIQWATPDLYDALKQYIDMGLLLPSPHPLLRDSHKSGILKSGKMSTRAIGSRVYDIGKAIGIDGLTPTDCRHSAINRYFEKCRNRSLQHRFEGSIAAKHIYISEMDAIRIPYLGQY